MFLVALRVLALAMLISCAPGAAWAEAANRPGAADWPMFRGSPQMLGIAHTEIRPQPELVWRFETGGPIVSSPAVVNGRVYVGSNDGNLYCVDLQTGQKVWAFETENAIEAPPTVRDGVVYVGSADGRLYAVNASDGQLVWRFETDGKVLGGVNFVTHPDTGVTTLIFGSYDSFLYGVNAATGEPRWSLETGNYVNAMPVISPEGDLAVVGGCDSVVRFVTTEAGEQTAAIEADAYIAGSGAWRDTHYYLGHYGSMVLAIDVDAASVDWRYRDRDFPFFSSPAVSEDTVYIGGRDRKLHAIDRATGKPKWTARTRGQVDSSPVVVGGNVVVGSEDGRLYLVAAETGQVTWRYDVGRPIISSPAVAAGSVLIGADDGRLYHFK